MDGLLLSPDHTCSKKDTRSLSCFVELGVASSARFLRGLLGVVAGLRGDATGLLYREDEEEDNALELLSGWLGDRVLPGAAPLGEVADAWTVFSIETVLGPVVVKDVREELRGLLREYVESTVFCVREVREELRGLLTECDESKGMFGRIDDASVSDVFEE